MSTSEKLIKSCRKEIDVLRRVTRSDIKIVQPVCAGALTQQIFAYIRSLILKKYVILFK